MSMQDFYTRGVANEGKKVPLYRPDGTKSDEYFIILGIDSDVFRSAETAGKRKMMEASSIEDPDKRAERVDEIEREVVASLVQDWSFDEECTREKVAEFFKEAPQLQKMVNTLAAQRSYFFGKESNPSSTGSKKTRS